MAQRVLRASIAAFIAAFACLAVYVPSADAAGGLTLSPPLKDITLGPGLLETTTEVTLTNNTTQAVRTQLKLIDLKALGEFGGSSLGQAGLPDAYNLANWMSLPGGDTVTIPAGQTVRIKVVITNRSDLAPGGHYGALVVSADSTGASKGNVSISQQLVSLVFVKKLGGEKYGLHLQEMLVDQARGQLPQSVKLNFASTGNVHVIPRGYIEVTDPSGKLVAKGIINSDSSLVLPGVSRQLTTALQSVNDSSATGQYKITAHYRYDGEEDFQVQSVYYTRSGIPRTLLLGAKIVAAIVLAGLAAYVVKRKVRRFKK